MDAWKRMLHVLLKDEVFSCFLAKLGPQLDSGLEFNCHILECLCIAFAETGKVVLFVPS